MKQQIDGWESLRQIDIPVEISEKLRTKTKDGKRNFIPKIDNKWLPFNSKKYVVTTEGFEKEIETTNTVGTFSLWKNIKDNNKLFITCKLNDCSDGLDTCITYRNLIKRDIMKLSSEDKNSPMTENQRSFIKYLLKVVNKQELIDSTLNFTKQEASDFIDSHINAYYERRRWFKLGLSATEIDSVLAGKWYCFKYNMSHFTELAEKEFTFIDELREKPDKCTKDDYSVYRHKSNPSVFYVEHTNSVCGDRDTYVLAVGIPIEGILLDGTYDK